MGFAAATIDAEILAEVILQDHVEMRPEVAESLLKLAFSEEQKAQMRELADRNNRGSLSDEERALMESYRRVGQFISLIQAKARNSLKRTEQKGL